jgi:ketosteroid isomerase-like protein
MEPDEAAERISSWSEPWAKGDFSDAIRLIADDAVMTAYMPEGVARYRGREAILAYLREFTDQWRHYRVETEAIDQTPDGVVVVSGRQLGTGRMSGIEIADPVHVAHVLRGDEIVGWHWHVEREKALEAAGVPPPG